MAEAIEARRIEIVSSADAVVEFLDACAYPRVRRLIDPVEAAGIAELLSKAGIAGTFPIVRVCRDPDDDFLLALAKFSDADILVTRDEDLLVIGQYGRTQIVYPAEFLRRLSEQFS